MKSSFFFRIGIVLSLIGIAAASMPASVNAADSEKQYYYSDETEFIPSNRIVVDSSGNVVENYQMKGTPTQWYYSSSGKTFDYNIPIIVDGNEIGQTISVKIGLRGDANLDHKISSADASMSFSEYKKIYKTGKGSFTDWQLFLANVDSDTGLNGWDKLAAKDSSYIFSYYRELYKTGKAKYPFL